MADTDLLDYLESDNLAVEVAAMAVIAGELSDWLGSLALPDSGEAFKSKSADY